MCLMSGSADIKHTCFIQLNKICSNFEIAKIDLNFYQDN